MKVRLILIFVLSLATTANAQQNYDASLIPRELLPYASSVIRNQEESIEVKDFGNALLRVKKAVTVLNKNGDDNAHIAIYYDKSDVIKNIKGVVYNDFGKQVSKFNESDFLDEAVGDGSLFSDQRVKHYLPAVTQYPYTIVCEYEVRLKQTLYFLPWMPNDHIGEAVEKSSFVFTCHPDFNIRFKETNLSNKVTVGLNSENEKTYSWQVNKLKAIKYEEFSPDARNFLTSVEIAPEKFSFYGRNGSFNTWADLGKWEYDNLVADRQDLPIETVEKVKELTKDISEPKLKAKKIYEYMQGKTHYISVQVCVGGWQPFLAADVDKQNYGDCKALVNYTQALLKAINIDSYYCIVNSGEDFKTSMPGDFPCMMGDHIILCIPFKNDTTWADCTSQTIPFGYLGSFTDDRLVLACGPTGGKLIRTPKYTTEQNLKSRKADFIIDSQGDISGSMTTLFKGIDYEYRNALINESTTEQNKILQKIYPINNMEISHYELKQDKSYNPFTTENIKLKARDYASLNGDKYFFMVNSVDRIEEPPRQVTNRQNDVYINRGYTDIDEITYTVPGGYHLGKEPLRVSIEKPFAKFTATMELKGDQLTYKRKLQLIDGTYSKDTYQGVVDFFQDVVDADEYTVSLVKN